MLRVGKVVSVVGHIYPIQLANIFACIVEQLCPLDLPSCQEHLSLVVCARAAFFFFFFFKTADIKLDTRRTVVQFMCFIYVHNILYVCTMITMINDQLPYLYIADALNDDETQSTAWNESSFSNLNYPFQLSENETEPLFQVHIRDRRQTSPGMIQTHACMLKYSHLNHGIHFW